MFEEPWSVNAIRMRVKRFWSAAKNMDTKELRRIMDEHDAVGALDMINEVLRTYT